MINYKQFKKELELSVEEAEIKDGSGPNVHSELLEIIFRDIKNRWDKPKDAMDEIAYVLKKVFIKLPPEYNDH